MESDAEKKWIAEAREYVGNALFDSLLSPPAPAPIAYFKEIIDLVAQTSLGV